MEVWALFVSKNACTGLLRDSNAIGAKGRHQNSKITCTISSAMTLMTALPARPSLAITATTIHAFRIGTFTNVPLRSSA